MNRVQRNATIKRVRAQVADLKKKVAADISAIVEHRRLTQAEAYAITGQQQSQISLIQSGKLRGFSLERLLIIRAMLGAEIEVEVTSSTRHSVTSTFN